MNNFFISIEGTYSDLNLALFNDQRIIAEKSSNNLKASSSLILQLDSILKNNKIKLSDLNFIAVNQGPGSFTSLRVVIATVNGISFATKIPLIGIDGLDALSLQTLKKITEKKEVKILISLLNAYGNEVYFSINQIQQNKLKKIGQNDYENIDILLDTIKTKFNNKKILFTGNGTILHKRIIQEKFKHHAIFSKEMILTPSAEQIGIMAYQKWSNKENHKAKLRPLYLKSQTFAIKK